MDQNSLVVRLSVAIVAEVVLVLLLTLAAYVYFGSLDQDRLDCNVANALVDDPKLPCDHFRLSNLPAKLAPLIDKAAPVREALLRSAGLVVLSGFVCAFIWVFLGRSDRTGGASPAAWLKTSWYVTLVLGAAATLLAVRFGLLGAAWFQLRTELWLDLGVTGAVLFALAYWPFGTLPGASPWFRSAVPGGRFF